MFVFVWLSHNGNGYQVTSDYVSVGYGTGQVPGYDAHSADQARSRGSKSI